MVDFTYQQLQFLNNMVSASKKINGAILPMLALTIGRKSVLDRRGNLPDYDDNPQKSLLGDALPVNKWVYS